MDDCSRILAIAVPGGVCQTQADSDRGSRGVSSENRVFVEVGVSTRPVWVAGGHL